MMPKDLQTFFTIRRSDLGTKAYTDEYVEKILADRRLLQEACTAVLEEWPEHIELCRAAVARVEGVTE